MSKDTNVFTVNAIGQLLPVKVGSATLLATYQTLSATATVSVVAPAALRFSLPPSLIVGSAATTATLLADFPGASNVNVIGFAGVGATLVSGAPTIASVTADGTLVNPTGTDFDGNGKLMLTGGASGTSASYVNLPNGLFSSLTNSGCTIEGWVNWYGPAGTYWTRIFDFGKNSAVDANGNSAEDVNGNPGLQYYLRLG